MPEAADAWSNELPLLGVGQCHFGVMVDVGDAAGGQQLLRPLSVVALASTVDLEQARVVRHLPDATATVARVSRAVLHAWLEHMCCAKGVLSADPVKPQVIVRRLATLCTRMHQLPPAEVVLPQKYTICSNIAAVVGSSC